jgi:hypothetical protein
MVRNYKVEKIIVVAFIIGLKEKKRKKKSI